MIFNKSCKVQNIKRQTHTGSQNHSFSGCQLTRHSVDGSQWPQHADRPDCREADVLQVEGVLQHPAATYQNQKSESETHLLPSRFNTYKEIVFV